MRKTVYLAAPIHKEEDSMQNAQLITMLRKDDWEVWSPQEAGIASEIAANTGRSLAEVRKEFCQKDLDGMSKSDVCVAYLGRTREPSQGMLWEMGWFYAMNKPVIFFNPAHNPITLMAEFTCVKIVHTYSELLKALDSVRHV